MWTMKRMPAARQWRDAVLLLLLIAALGITGCSGGDGGDHAQQSQAVSENSAAARDESGDREAAGGDRGSTNTGEPAKGPLDDRAPEPGAGTGETPPDEGSDPEPQAGMLTAGEWQDTNRWGNWLAQLNGDAGGRSQQLWSFHRFDRLVVEVTADGSTLSDVLDSLDASYPGIKARIVDEQGGLRRFVNVYVGNDDVRFLDGLNTPVADNAQVSVIPAVAGG